MAEVPRNEVIHTVDDRDGDMGGIVRRALRHGPELEELPCKFAVFSGGFEQRNAVERVPACAGGIGIAGASMTSREGRAVR